MALFLLVDEKNNKVSSDAIYCFFLHKSKSKYTLSLIVSKTLIQIIRMLFNACLNITQCIVRQSICTDVSEHRHKCVICFLLWRTTVQFTNQSMKHISSAFTRLIHNFCQQTLQIILEFPFSILRSLVTIMNTMQTQNMIFVAYNQTFY